MLSREHRGRKPPLAPDLDGPDLDGPDLTARLNGLREVLHSEIAAVEELLAVRIDGLNAERSILLEGINTRARVLQEELDRRFADLRVLLDERREAFTETAQLLQQEMDRRLAAADALNVQRIDDLRELMLTGQRTAQEAVQAALTAAKEAVITAQAAAEKRFDGVNEFRQTLSDQTATFLPRAEYAAAQGAISDRVAANADRLGALELRLTRRLDRGDGESAGADKQVSEQRLGTGLVLQVLVVIAAVAAVVVAIIVR
jgi:hypothetical protein